MRYSTGLELILNAAEGVLQIIVTDDEAVLCAQEWYRPERATEILTPALQEICAALNLDLATFGRIACVRGPGSFTGIRVVLATAAALRRAGRARLAALDYLQALACSAAMRRALLYGARVWVVTHARSNLVHCRPFVSLGPIIPPAPAQDVDLCAPRDALQRIMAASEAASGAEYAPVFVCGTGLARHAETFAPLFSLPEIHPMPELVSPDRDALRLLARHGDYFDEDIEPLYVRPCDALENLPRLAEKQGLDADEAAGKLERLLKARPASDI